ncbi:MAG TPA: hypothetical protein VHA75_08110 [Rugosimonospora sp.]|nr:hypothetical protein [Rugosimonospora sp.]
MTEGLLHYLTPWLVAVAFTLIGTLYGYGLHEWVHRREQAKVPWWRMRYRRRRSTSA